MGSVVLHLGSVQAHWYGRCIYWLLLPLMCWLGIAIKSRPDWNADMVADLVFYGAMGVILGGRIGYVLFYQLSEFLAKLMYLFR
ncbi:MAG: prolipoprotein diacylglyceryl transferase family protein [Moraxella osloensis]